MKKLTVEDIMRKAVDYKTGDASYDELREIIEQYETQIIYDERESSESWGNASY